MKQIQKTFTDLNMIRANESLKIFTLTEEIFLSLLQSLSQYETNLKLKVESN